MFKLSEISVIIPVYNVEKYLTECLDSICNQTFTDLEIICINDGSTDNSFQILTEYAQKDKRIKILTLSNKGLGAARNWGLKVASGKYVYFLDSDDYIDLTTMEKLHESIVVNDSDIVLFKFRTFDDFKNIHKRDAHFRIDKIFGDIDYSNFTFTYQDVKRHVLNTAFSACLKLYRKDFLDSFDEFVFDEGINFEDVSFHVKIMLRSSKISFVNESLYYYRSNPYSILNSTAYGFDIFKSIDSVEDFLRENDFYDEFENEFIFFKIAQILRYIISTDSEDYFNLAKKEFEGIVIKDESTLKKYALDGYKRVLNSSNYYEYLLDYYKSDLSKLKKQKRKLLRKNRKLKKINKELAASKIF